MNIGIDNPPNHTQGMAGASVPHDSAVKHVTGGALYVDDVPAPADLLHVATGLSTIAHGRISKMDLARVKAAPGVVDVITVADVPGDPDVSPVHRGDKLLAGNEVTYIGQPVFAVAATSFDLAQQAARLAVIDYEPLPPVLTIAEAMSRELFVVPTRTFEKGDSDAAMADAALTLESALTVRGQEHFYLEGQVSLATPTEDGGVHVLASSQHPSEIQKLVASVLGLPINRVQAEVRRMGGGFGGKESQAAALACTASLFAVRTGQPVKYRMSRQDDMRQTGKRHDFSNKIKAGFDKAGQLLSVQIELAALCGCTPDLSEAIVDRAMFHADNAYYYPAARIRGYRCQTNTVSNTAFRGFGGPQGMIAAESMMDDIARAVGKDPLDVRLLNLYRPGRDETPYGQVVEQHLLADMMEQLAVEANYRQRREAVAKFNQTHEYLRKGLALTPVKFGISFTSTHLNQAGALIHFYTDGSIHLNHGGTEMGQGLYTRVAQIVATSLGVSLERVAVTSTRTDKIPNTSPTAASSGTDINGMAARNAALTLKGRLCEFLAQHHGVPDREVTIADDQVFIKGEPVSFEDSVKLAYMNRIQLSATGFYRTPRIHFDKEAGKGHPFYYYANGAAVSEVLVDSLSGEYRVSQVHILHDVGHSINPALDIGQIEGGFVQGMGWLTTEELLWDEAGRVISDSPANYKIPTAYDVPEKFTVRLYGAANPEATVHRSKAVGEPPLMLALSVWCALRDAAASVADYRVNPPLAVPATPEQVYRAIQIARQTAGADPQKRLHEDTGMSALQ